MMIGREKAGSHVQIQRVLLWLRPDGWQGRARRNAWAAMVVDSRRRQDRVLAEREAQRSAVPALQAQVP
jgi:hypothetical protein